MDYLATIAKGRELFGLLIRVAGISWMPGSTVLNMPSVIEVSSMIVNSLLMASLVSSGCYL